MIPGFNDIFFNSIKHKIKYFTDKAKECVLRADEMSLKSNLYYMLNKDEIIGFPIILPQIFWTKNFKQSKMFNIKCN